MFWAPYAIAMQHPPRAAAWGTATVALLVPASVSLDLGSLDSIPFSWSGVLVPMLLVSFAGGATILARSRLSVAN